MGEVAGAGVIREIYDEKTAGKLLRVDSVISSGQHFRGEDDMGRLLHMAKTNLRHKLAEEIVDKFFVFERIAITDCVSIRGSCYVLTPDEYRAALLRAYEKGKDSALRFQM